MTTRFTKKVFNAEDGTRTLGLYITASTLPPLTFNVNVLEDMRHEIGGVETASRMAAAIREILKIEPTPEEIEFAMKGI